MLVIYLEPFYIFYRVKPFDLQYYKAFQARSLEKTKSRRTKLYRT